MKYLIFLALSFYQFCWAQSAAEAMRITNSATSFYDVLKVRPDATDKEIKKAYRRLMSLYHPDRHQNNPTTLKAATQVMTKLNTVRDTLLDPLKRKSYDITVKATASFKSSSAKSRSDWQKYAYKDVTKPAQPEAKAANAEASKKAHSDPVKESPKGAESKSSADTASSRKDLAVSAQPEVHTNDVKIGDTQKIGSMTTTGKMANKMYIENSQCGLDYFGHFIDIIQ